MLFHPLHLYISFLCEAECILIFKYSCLPVCEFALISSSELLVEALVVYLLVLALHLWVWRTAAGELTEGVAVTAWIGCRDP